MILANKVLAVTGSDSVDDPNGPFLAGVIVGVGGNATILAVGDTTARAFTALVAGQYLPIKVKRVNSTGLTATLYGLKI